jgi:hypothetical protein
MKLKNIIEVAASVSIYNSYDIALISDAHLQALDKYKDRYVTATVEAVSTE